MTVHAQTRGLAAADVLSGDDMRFLEEITAAVVQESRVAPGAKIGDIGPNVTGGTLIRPGGHACYPAFWIRDYAMSLEAGCVTPEEQKHMLLLTATHQQDEELELRSGSVVTRGSIADHISFSNKPIFYPGILDDYENQGGPQWGKLPCLDDAFFFIHMAACYVCDTSNDGQDVRAVLAAEVRGKSLLQRLEEAYAMPPSRPDTGLVYADEDNRGVTFGFVDVITHTGDLLFCSVLKYRAARELADLLTQCDNKSKAEAYRAGAEKLKAAIKNTFATERGFLRASTGKSAQPDVWGTAFAVYVGAVDGDTERKACAALAKACRAGLIAWRGNIRHVPTDADYSDSTAWELSKSAKNRYQNGAYWGTPTGWVCYAAAKVDREMAAQLAKDYIDELRDGDFRKGPEFGSPWECMHPDGNHRQNPVYMTSVTCPLAAFRRMANEGP